MPGRALATLVAISVLAPILAYGDWVGRPIVRVGVADAGEQAWIGERALQGVILAREGGAETRRVRLESDSRV